jgi:hypothetical protein
MVRGFPCRCLATLIAPAIIACASHAERGGVSAERAEVAADDDPALIDAYKRAYDSSDVALYRSARDQHAAWIEAHPKEKAREVRGRYAKLLFALGEYQRAAAELEVIADAAKGRAPDYVERGAMRNRALALLHAVKEGDKPSSPLRLLRERGRLDKMMLAFNVDPIALPDFSDKSAPNESPMPELERAFAEACDAYVAVAEPEDGALPTIVLLSASAYFARGRVAEGSSRCGDLVARWPHNEIATMCVRAAIGGLLARQDWKNLEKHSRAFRGNLSLIGADHELERYLERMVQVSTFNRIQADAEMKTKDRNLERQNLINGAEAYRGYQREFPFSDNADKALYNVFVYSARAGRRADAIAAGQQLLLQYATSELVPQVKHGLRQLESQPMSSAR